MDKEKIKEILDNLEFVVKVSMITDAPVQVPLEHALIFSDFLKKEIQIMEEAKELEACRNELCLKCGNYKESHLGACNGCRWKE